ncbi:helix-turn-helix transcriptional regulator [Streptomyces sp. NPDC005786]|uniref:helix-turn-helix domain-containing protein n=1 Tax=unclassified Streptomyces TaxID=2593676 RepID=UPI0033EB80CD
MFGALLRFYRERAGLSQEALGAKIGFSKSQVAMVERGLRPPKGDFTSRADAVLGADGALTVVAEKLTFSHLASWFEPFAEEERTARARYEYESNVVPGILQTAEYARTVFGGAYPPIDDDEIEGRVAARLARQSMLTCKPTPDISFILEVGLITRPIGGRMVHLKQLERIIDVSELRHVHLQVMPPYRETHSGLSGPFVLLETADRRRLAYLEVQTSTFLVREQPQLGVLFGKYGILRAQALDPDRSRRYIEKVVMES